MPQDDGEQRLHGPSSEPNEQIEVSIEQASRLLEVPAATIRSWERRYRLPGVGSELSGERRYSPEAMRVLRLLRDYIAGGFGTVDAAAVVEAGPNPAPERLVSALLQAAYHLQPPDIHHILDTSLEAFGLDRTVDEVLFPALREIGREWVTGSFDVAQEHVASEATQAWLARIRQEATPASQPQPIVLACGPRDQHTMGLEALGVLLSRRGWECLLLGARTPAESLSRTVQQLGPAAVVVVSHLIRARHAAATSVRSAAAHGTPVFVAGRAFRSRASRYGLPATHLGDGVSGAADLITMTLASGRRAG